MTTITIEQSLLEQALDALSAPNHRVFSESPICVGIRAALEAPATAPEFPADWAQMIHYPECWDTAAYPELRDALHEALAWSGCSVCKPATAPDELERLRQIAHLTGTIFCYGNFVAETHNEAVLEKLLRENGTFWDSVEQYEKSQGWRP